MSFVICAIIILKQTKIVFSTVNGCNDDYSTDSIELNNGHLFACSGRDHWLKNCGDGYHVCANAREVSFLNLTRNQCANISPKNEIFLTYEYTYGLQCESYPNDNITPTNDDIFRVWGCSSKSSGQIESNSCGVLNTAIQYYETKQEYQEIMSTLCCKDAPPTGCEPWTIHTELIPGELYICPTGETCGDNYHICRNAAEIALFGIDTGIFPAKDGVICCRDGNGGCQSKGGETELIPNTIYACPGKFMNNEDADIGGCGPFYHVCNSMSELQALNVSAETCHNAGENGEFFGTLEGITMNTCNSSIDGIWGCSQSTTALDGCGILNSVIVGGNMSDVDGVLCCNDGEWTDANWTDIPFMVQLRNPEFFCGGSILTLDGHNGNGAILTAAHCIAGGRIASELSVYIGCTTSECTEKTKSNYSVQSLSYHQLYNGVWDNPIGIQHDIGIVYLTEPITHPNAISVVIESNPMAADNNGIVKVTGYSGYGGPDARGGSDTDSLEYAITNIMSRSECAEYHPEFKNFTSLPTTLCLRSDDITANGMITMCNGDSGSAIMHKGKQIGIVSWGHDTCDPFYPQVLVYVPSFYNWIASECGLECLTGEYLGCYIENKANPALPTMVDGTNFDIQKCRDACNGYEYYALQNNGIKCGCGNDYEKAIKYGISNKCVSKLGGFSSNSLFVHSGSKQIKYYSDDILSNNALNLRYGPGQDPTNNIKYTKESCRVACSQFKYFSVSAEGKCHCDNSFDTSFEKDKYDRYGLFENIFIDGIEINVNCDNFLNGIWFKNDEYSDFVSLQLESGESYPFDDWTKTQKVTISNSANCGLVRIECANAMNDDGPAGLMVGIKYKNEYVSSNWKTINNDVISLVESTSNRKEIVLSSQSSTTPLTKPPFNAEWIWTCGDNGHWDCGEAVINVFQINLCELSVADDPNIWYHYHTLYLLFSVSMFVNVVLFLICCINKKCCNGSKYRPIKHIHFDDEQQVSV